MKSFQSGGALAATLLALCAAPVPGADRPPPHPAIESFSPQGTVREVRQVTVRFTVPMVALGDPRLPDPFSVDCPAPGRGRWADPRNWVYDFEEDLGAGLKCSFTLRPRVRTAAGEPLGGATRFSFDTGGPAVRASLPHEGWEKIDESQVFLLRTDAVATPQSVQAHAWCAVDGLNERIPLDVLTGADRQRVLDERKALGYDDFELLWKSGQVTRARVRNRDLEKAEATVNVVRCRRALPPGAGVLINWGAGIATPSGIATTEDQTLAFKVRPAFLAQVECTRTNARAGCMPVLPLSVTFSAPVPRAQALAIRLKDAAGRLWEPEAGGEGQAPTLERVNFPGPLPASSTITVLIPEGFADDAGRTLENRGRFPLAVRIDAFPPLVKFTGNFGILESREGGILPVTLRNVERSLPARRTDIPAKLLKVGSDPKSILEWMRRVDESQTPHGDYVGSPRTWRDRTGSTSVFGDEPGVARFTVRKPLGSRPEEVVGIPLGSPGFYVVELRSEALGAALLGESRPRYVSTSALVTDLAVHFKWGREGSLAWVTRLSTGTPVAGVSVLVADGCDGRLLWEGRSDGSGRAAVPDRLPAPEQANCNWGTHHPLLVLARTPEDFSFTLTGWSQGITPYDFSLPVGNAGSADIYATVLDRTLFRAGESVSMEHVLRRHVLTGIALQPQATHWVSVRHSGSGQRYALEASFDASGVGTSRWQIPGEAKLGDYEVSIDNNVTAHFRVEEFRLPSMRASVAGPATPQVAPRSVELDLHVAYLSGGGAAGLPVKLRTFVEPRPLHLSDYADYQFGGEPVTPGITTGGRGAQDYDFDPEAQSAGEGGTTRTRTLPLTLDAAGSARVAVNELPPLAGPARLVAELEYADANGEILTTTGTVALRPAALSVGIRPEGWAGSQREVRFRVLVLDANDQPRAAQPVQVSLYQSSEYSYRRRLIGGFYAYETTHETRKLAAACSGTTDAQGLLSCAVSPGVSGQVIVRAEARDAAGRLAGATSTMWVYDEDDWWFGGTSGDRMDVLPEKKEYQAGETARFQVRMPFRTATALVTVEREGVLRSFVTRLSGRAPVVAVPIEPGDSPNVYVSVLAVRGRVAHAQAGDGTVLSGSRAVTALVDLTKPAYRLGTTQVRIGWQPHRLEVRVEPARPTYRVREHVPVKIRVAAADGTALAPGSEVAVAAVDEALLDLSPNPTWNLLEAMMGQRGLEVWTSTAQMQVVGKRHYGRKALPHGGGGGREPDRARELFDSLLLWSPRVQLDANGEATLSVPLNDSLSSFRIVAVARSGTGRFGTGSAGVRTPQDLVLVSGLPPLVREGDAYAAVFSVRNTTDRPLAVHVAAASRALGAPLAPQELEVPAGRSRDITWRVLAPVGRAALDWEVTARAGDAQDRLKVTEAVIPAVPVRTYQATLAQLTQPLTMPARIPQGAIAGRGGLEVTLQGRLAGNLDGVTDYMGRYPYTCLEQQTSRAIALGDRASWEQIARRLPAYMDGDGLLRYFPIEWLQGDDGLTAYVLSITQEAGWPIADADRERLLNALTRFVEGRLTRDSALPTADLTIRRLQALDALSRYGAARPEMLATLAVDPTLLPTSALIDWVGVLSRTEGVPDREARIDQGLMLLRSRLNFQGTTMGFSTERTDALWWLMVSADSNANRMLLTVLGRPQWREDIPRLVRGALGRQKFGHWNTTVANAWGVLAVGKFSAAFESVPVTGTSTVSLGADTHSIPWPHPATAPALELPWPAGTATLEVRHLGTGAPWALVRATAALPLEKPLFTGFKVRRTLVPVEQQHPGAWTRGDVVRVHLELEAQTDATWVVVDDPIPAGSTILGGSLNGQSALLRRDEQRSGYAWLAYEERRFEGYRAYYRFVPAGHWSCEYTVRLNDPGTFQLPATRVEAMYAPEMLGELPNAPFTVGPAGAP